MSNLMGGKHAPSEATDKGRELANKHREDIESKTGQKFDIFEPVQQRTQVVAGTNYFMKIRTGANQFVHARIWHKLDGASELHSAEAGKSEADEL